MSSVHPTPSYPAYAQPTAYNPYENQQPPGYYAAPPGSMPQQGFSSPQGYYVPPGSAPQAVYSAPPGVTTPVTYIAPPGSAPPPGYSATPQYAPMPGAVVSDPTYGGMPPGYNASYGAMAPPGTSYPVAYGNGVVVAVPMTQQPFGDPSKPQEQDPANRIETGRWSSGLCSCCDSCIPNMCMSWCCPCVSLAQIYARIGLATYRMALVRFIVIVVAGFVLRSIVAGRATPESYTAYWDANGNYVVQSSGPDIMAILANLGYLLIQILFAVSVLHARTRIRQRFKIPGNGCCDCVIACCCSCCAIAQMATHVKSYKPGDCSFGAPDVLPPFN